MNLYLRNVITEGPDAGYGYAVEPNATDSLDGFLTNGTDIESYLAFLPGILVHPSYLENHKVGFLPDDWEEGYEIKDSTGWQLCHELMYSKFPDDKRRKVIVPRSSNVEDAGEVGKKGLVPVTPREKALVTGALMSGFQHGHGDKYPEPFIDRMLAGEFTKLCEIWKVTSMIEPSTPPNKEGERGEKDAEDFLRKQGYSDSVTYPDKTTVEPTFQWVTVIRLLNEFAALSTRGKDAVEDGVNPLRVINWLHNNGLIAWSGTTEKTTGGLAKLFLVYNRWRY